MEVKQRFWTCFFPNVDSCTLQICCPFWKLAFARQQLMKDLKENPKLTQELLRNLLLCCSTLFQRSIHAADQRFARLSSSHCHVVLGQNHVFYSIFTTCLHIFAYFCAIRKLTSYFSGIDRVFLVSNAESEQHIAIYIRFPGPPYKDKHAR